MYTEGSINIPEKHCLSRFPCLVVSYKQSLCSSVLQHICMTRSLRTALYCFISFAPSHSVHCLALLLSLLPFPTLNIALAFAFASRRWTDLWSGHLFYFIFIAGVQNFGSVFLSTRVGQLRCACFCCTIYGPGWEYIIKLSLYSLFNIMIPRNCPFAALSRTFRALSRPSRIGIGKWYHVFVWICRTKGLYGDRIGNITYISNAEVEAFDKVVFQIAPQRKHKVKQLWRGFEAATWQDKLDHFGPGWDPGRLAFRQPFANLPEPFADFSPTKMFFETSVSWEDDLHDLLGE